MAKLVGDPLVGKRLKMARCGADLSREEMAALISHRIGGKGISDELLRRIEVGERDVERSVLKAVAEITGEDEGWLDFRPSAMRPYVKARQRDLALVTAS